MSSKKLFDQSVKLEKLWSHIFTATISLTQPEAWFRKVREIVEKQQSGPIWMSETKVTLPTCSMHQHHFLHACHYLIYFDFSLSLIVVFIVFCINDMFSFRILGFITLSDLREECHSSSYTSNSDSLFNLVLGRAYILTKYHHCFAMVHEGY